MPRLTNVYLPNAFEYKDGVTIRGSTHFIPLSRIDIGALHPFFNIQTPEMYEYCMSILRGSDEMTDLVIGDYACPFDSVTAFDLSVYPRLKSVTIGDYGFEYVNVFNITGLSELESVEIGKNSFTRHKNGYANNPNRHFYLKDCPKLKSLKMGRYSFSDYTVCEIENVDALEEIEMGELGIVSSNFWHASLELKSILIHSE